MQFSPEQAHDVLPYLRRADFETRAAALIIPGVAVRVNTNQQGTSSFVELVTADVRITALTRSRLRNRLPSAHYRETRARSSQTTIFERLGEREDDNPAAQLYGTFIYGGRGDALSIASVFFPIPNEHLLTIPPINLLREQAAVVDQLMAKAQEIRPMEETVEAALGLKRKADEEQS